MKRHPSHWMLVPGLKHTIISTTDLMSLMCTPRPLSLKACVLHALYWCGDCVSVHVKMKIKIQIGKLRGVCCYDLFSAFGNIIFLSSVTALLLYEKRHDSKIIIQCTQKHCGLIIIIRLTFRACGYLLPKWLCKQLTCIRDRLRLSIDFHL